MKNVVRALVVDDDEFSRNTATRTLQRSGVVSVSQAIDGAQALNLADACEMPFDLVLCDLCMPDLDGIETLAGLAARCRSAMFVLTSSAEPRLLRAAASTAQRAGIVSLHVISKPITSTKLKEALDAMEAERSAAVVAPGPARTYGFTAADIRDGLVAGQFDTFYQPKVNVADRRICGAEALIRWRHPKHGLIPPGAFIKLAQEASMLNDIFFVALSAAVADCARWTREGYAAGISINLPVDALFARDLPNRLEAFVAEHHLAPARVTFELTEDGWLHEQDLAREVLTRIRLRGFGLAIDDFGTGYSGLQQLLNAPFNELKIDQGFVRAAPVDHEAAIAVGHIATLGRQLGLTVVAEGVEDQTQWDLVARLGCDQVQGYLITHPLSASRFEAWLAEDCLARNDA